MFGLITGIVFVIVAVIAFVVMKKTDKKEKTIKFTSLGVSVVTLILSFVCIGFSCVQTVEAGHTGIGTTFGRVENYTFDAGFHLKAPWNQVIMMDNRVQKMTVEMECFSSDIQEVQCKFALNYQISKNNAQDLYRTVGISYADTVISPNIRESVKVIMAKYTAENLIGSRDTLANEIEALLADQLKKYDIEVVSTAIEDIDFTDEFTNAVEAKQVALQNKLKATTEQEQKTMEANQAAERAKIEANAQAEVAKIQAQADLEVQKINADAAEYTGLKESAKNKAISESLTPELIRYYLIQRWNGEYPSTYMGTGNVSTLLNLPETESEHSQETQSPPAND